MSRVKFNKLSRDDLDYNENVSFQTSFHYLPTQTLTSQNFKFQSYGSSHIVEPFNGLKSNVEIEMTPFNLQQNIERTEVQSEKSSRFRISAAILIGLSGFLGFLTLFSHYAANESIAAPDDLKQPKHPQMSIVFDDARYRYRVIDNYPLLNPNVAFNKMIGVSSSEHVLAYGTNAMNANGNGWNYLSAQAVDLSGYSMAESIPKDQHGHTPKLTEDEFDELIMQQYFRSLEAIGYLEGYSTCVQMNEWYVNFYSGMFDGGNPTDESMEFLLTNHDWMVEQSMLYWQTSEYWRTVRGVLSQLAGIVNGANAGCPGDESTLATAEKKVYLNDLSREHSIIHILLMNANGDMYQLDDKYSQDLAAPSDVLNDIPNDDGYFFELQNNATDGSNKNKGEGDADLFPTAGEAKKGYYYHRGEAKKRIEARKLAASTDSEKVKRTVKPTESYVGGHLRSRRSQRKLSELYTKEIADCNTDIDTAASQRRRLNMQTHRHDHCSALIKLLDDKSDVLFGHDTWDDFQNAAPRIFKHYTMNLMSGYKPNGTHEVQFSSSPGMVTSNDDFFISKGNAKIAVIETTIDMSNRTLLNDIVPESMLSWGRSHIANQLATDGESWCNLFSMYHSGTYVNQWMVLNFDKFTPLVGPQEGFLHVLEEVPTFIHYQDLTDVLVSTGYWASYNEPYFTDIAQLSLSNQLCAENSEFCYNTDPRAEIFKRDQGKVAGIKDMQWIMGYNNFQNDPLSLGDACQSIACRMDLRTNASLAAPFGAIDSKISSVMLSTRPVPITLTRLGPTHDEQIPFCWAPWDELRDARGEKYHHAGHPPCFDFDWQTMPPYAEV